MEQQAISKTDVRHDRLTQLLEQAREGVADGSPDRIARQTATLERGKRKAWLKNPLRIGAQKVLDRYDPVSFMRVMQKSYVRAGLHPTRLAAANLNYTMGLTAAWQAAVARGLGAEMPPPLMPAPSDRRFSHPTWQKNAYFFLIQQMYLLGLRHTKDVIEAAQLSEKERAKALFAAEMFSDMLAPTNFLWTNPEAIQTAFETGGLSVVRGLRRRLHDLVHNKGMPQMVDTSKVRIGETTAATKGKVVFRNELIELIQYEPQTEQVHAIPLLCSPAWINRYYIMDLAPGRSLIEWAVQHGHTVFAISYRNPDESMRDTTFSDYMFKSPLAAIDVIREITGSQKVNVVSVCLGGTLTTATMAYLNEVGVDAINTSTLLNSHTDFTIPGDLGCFVDEPTVDAMDRRNKKHGYAAGADFALTFNLIRAHDLIWNYVSRGWLMGEAPPAFDLLAWNGDSTNLPAKMHSYYLRCCYLENALARDQMYLAGKRLRPTQLKQDIYVVGAEADHIVPWHSSYKATQIFAGNVRYILSSAGHVAGIVNPPGPKPCFYADDVYPPDPETWRAGASKVQKTWWLDWADWVGARAGSMRTPPPMGSALHPVLCDAPGQYVRT